MLRRTLCLIGVSLMFCVGQQDEENLLAIDKKMVEVGLPLQISAQPIEVNAIETSGLWVQNGRFLVYAFPTKIARANETIEDSNVASLEFLQLWLYDTKSGKSRLVTQDPVLGYQCDAQGIYLVSGKRVSEDPPMTLLSVQFFNPLSGRAQVLWETSSPNTYGYGGLSLTSPDGRYLVFGFSLHSVLIDRNLRQVVASFSEEFHPIRFLDNTQLYGWGRLSLEETKRRGFVFHIPTKQLREATPQEEANASQSVPLEVLPSSLQQAVLPERSKNLEAVKKEGALYLYSRTGKGDEYRAVLLTYDAIDFALGPDFIPVIEENQVVEIVPNPRRLAAFIAPDESGLAYVNLHKQLFYIPLTQRDPKDLVEMLACGVEPTPEAVMENYMNNAKQIATALLMYAQDYDEYFPPAENAQNLLHPYLKNPTLFTDPRTGQNIFTYLLNGDSLGAIRNPVEKRIGILDWGDPEWIIVIFADGHVKRVPRGQ